jgi:cell division protein FtsQ
MSLVAAPSDRRFHRSHVKPARRRAWQKLAGRASIVMVAAALVLLACYRAGGLVAHSQVLHVEHIAVRGNLQLSTGEVIGILSGLEGQSVISADLEKWRQKLLASPWVRDAALHRSLPSTIEVAISEREPIGIGRIDGSLYLIDEHGAVIDEYGPQYAEFDLPIVEGAAAVPSSGHAAADEDRAGLAARVAASLKPSPDIAGRLSEIDVSDAHNAAVTLSGEPAVIYLGEDRFRERLQSYLELSAALRDRVPEIDYVDLRFDGRIYVRPSGKTGKARAVKR